MRTDAIRLLTHYMRTVFEANGLKWDGDNEAELTALVDALTATAVAAAYQKMQRLGFEPDLRG